jgi:hypothetical protein
MPEVNLQRRHVGGVDVHNTTESSQHLQKRKKERKKKEIRKETPLCPKAATENPLTNL